MPDPPRWSQAWNIPQAATRIFSVDPPDSSLVVSTIEEAVGATWIL